MRYLAGQSRLRFAGRRYADLSDKAFGVSDDGVKSDRPSRSGRSRHYRVIHTGSLGCFETGRTILQNQASVWRNIEPACSFKKHIWIRFTAWYLFAGDDHGKEVSEADTLQRLQNNGQDATRRDGYLGKKGNFSRKPDDFFDWSNLG